jgi:hypothetical protein
MLWPPPLMVGRPFLFPPVTSHSPSRSINRMAELSPSPFTRARSPSLILSVLPSIVVVPPGRAHALLDRLPGRARPCSDRPSSTAPAQCPDHASFLARRRAPSLLPARGPPYTRAQAQGRRCNFCILVPALD